MRAVCVYAICACYSSFYESTQCISQTKDISYLLIFTKSYIILFANFYKETIPYTADISLHPYLLIFTKWSITIFTNLYMTYTAS